MNDFQDINHTPRIQKISNLEMPRLQEPEEGFKPLGFKDKAPTVSELVQSICTGYGLHQNRLGISYQSYDLDPIEESKNTSKKLQDLHNRTAGLSMTCNVGQQHIIQQSIRALVLHPLLLDDPARSEKFVDKIVNYVKSIENLDDHNFAGISQTHSFLMEISFFDKSQKLKIREMLNAVKLGIKDGGGAFILAESERFYNAVEDIPYQEIGFSVKSLEALLDSATRINVNEPLTPGDRVDYQKIISKYLLQLMEKNHSLAITGWDNWRESPEAISILYRVLTNDADISSQITFYDFDDNFNLIEYYSNSNQTWRVLPVLRGEPCYKVFNPFSLLSHDAHVRTWEGFYNRPEGLAGCFATNRAQYADFPNSTIATLYSEDNLTEQTYQGRQCRPAATLIFNNQIFDTILFDGKLETATAVKAIFNYDNYFGAVAMLKYQRILPFINGRFITEVPEGEILEFNPYHSNENMIIGTGTVKRANGEIVQFGDLEVIARRYI